MFVASCKPSAEKKSTEGERSRGNGCDIDVCIPEEVDREHRQQGSSGRTNENPPQLCTVHELSTITHSEGSPAPASVPGRAVCSTPPIRLGGSPMCQAPGAWSVTMNG